MKRLICLSLSRETKAGEEWLIANGMNMGRWTLSFGVHCLADTLDCKLFVENVAAEHINDEKYTLREFVVEKLPRIEIIPTTAQGLVRPSDKQQVDNSTVSCEIVPFSNKGKQ